MALRRRFRRTVISRAFAGWTLAALLLTCASISSGADSPMAPPMPKSDGPPPLPMPVPLKPPRSLASVAEFVDTLGGGNDGTFEVPAGQARIMTLKASLSVPGKPGSTIAVGDPSVLEYQVINDKQIRLIGQRIGTTDLSITNPNGETYSFAVQVVPGGLDVLRVQLRANFPDATLKLSQIRDHIIVEGQARDTAQVARIMEVIKAFLASVQASQMRRIVGQQARAPGLMPVPPEVPRPSEGAKPPEGAPMPQPVAPEQAPTVPIQTAVATPQVINLIRVPGTQQVLLKVRIAELNRTALREIGADFLAVDQSSGATIGSVIGGSTITATAALAGRKLNSLVTMSNSGKTTAFGIFEKGGFDIFLSALRRNSLVKILAEPNLVAMNGHEASFLAGGEYPVPVPQAVTGGAGTTVTVQFKQFGVRLSFVPYIQDDEVIRLSVDPEVSTIDQALGTTLVPGGSPVPGLNTRRAHTVVELRQGQTLAMAGLLQVTLDGQTNRIPGLGDLPILGPFFSNTTSQRIEKELVVLVTPYLVEPMSPEQVPHTPGDEVKTPNDLEFYLLNRIEGRTHRDARPTTEYDDALYILRCFMKLESERACGPRGYCE